MKVDVLLGLQWGDEGKGKIVDYLTPGYDIIARFQGGPNAGHTLEIKEIQHILHTIPSGIFHPGRINLIGNGVVIDPIVLHREIRSVEKLGVDLKSTLLISKKAHLILPTHRILDAASEAQKGDTKIGSTLKGIGPTYMDKTGRNGLRVGDILLPGFREKYHFLVKKHRELLKLYDFSYKLKEYEEGWFEGIEAIRSFHPIDTEHYINQALKEKRSVLAEGAQGTLLDIDFGSYPYVTSSNTICAGACIGLGIAPNRIGEVTGIFKAYCTRVGSGPFPTELDNSTGEMLREAGHEFGSTTGRPRRCGWLDLVALKYSIMLNGVTRLIMTKADVLNRFATIRVCTAYRHNGKETFSLPFDLSDNVQPVYREFKGWMTDTSGYTSFSELPREMSEYVRFIEEETGVPVKMISVGPERDQTIYR
ncbi:MAG: adenylosuccinate synthase [Bacteroidales bacterium]